MTGLDLTDKEFARRFYLDWIKDETNNNLLTGNEPGIRMAIEKLVAIDPEDILHTNTESTGEIRSKKICDLQIQYGSSSSSSETIQANKQIPTSIYDWIRPYRVVRW